jgi:hypothetical protein
MPKININKTNAAASGEIEISFTYDKTILHYLKRFIKEDRKYNPAGKTWTVPASNETGLMLFLEACREWCEIHISEPSAVADPATETETAALTVMPGIVAVDTGKSYSWLASRLEYYHEREMVREAAEIRRQMAALEERGRR